jgi:hypothetical protein
MDLFLFYCSYFIIIIFYLGMLFRSPSLSILCFHITLFPVLIREKRRRNCYALCLAFISNIGLKIFDSLEFLLYLCEL